ncbi:hypothetical protein GNP94_22110 [Paenibacillus campinasensis]|uniref:Uncharacterized protein n=1 Tax=Paenibacillus campinasensis TaxID=66347 RepID=A0ABW9T6E0_9BACL|nr:hypothetical protein [Paenibacillus campinasensis]MUG68669.1 hypothetical protein [Paenibacillus campinasensis]
MKELIYLDTAFLHSFIAQQHKGLPISYSTEFQESETKSDTQGKSGELQNEVRAEFKTGEFSIPGILNSPSGTTEYKLGHTKSTNAAITLTQLEAGKEIISKQLHDDAFQQFEDYLKENSLVTQVNDNHTWRNGEYVSLRKPFAIYDIAHIKNIFNPEGIGVAMEFALSASIQHERARLEAAAEKDFKSKLRGFEQSEKKEYEAIKKELGKFRQIIDYFESLLPSPTFIKSGNVICPLKHDNLRESASLLNFKYGQDEKIPINILGKYTRRFDQYVDLASTFGPIGEAINQFDSVFEILGIIKKGDRIVSPIAIYFE